MERSRVGSGFGSGRKIEFGFVNVQDREEKRRDGRRWDIKGRWYWS